MFSHIILSMQKETETQTSVLSRIISLDTAEGNRGQQAGITNRFSKPNVQIYLHLHSSSLSYLIALENINLHCKKTFLLLHCKIIFMLPSEVRLLTSLFTWSRNLLVTRVWYHLRNRRNFGHCSAPGLSLSPPPSSLPLLSFPSTFFLAPKYFCSNIMLKVWKLKA